MNKLQEKLVLSLSVIIPTFKNVEFFEELIQSIEKTNFRGEIEILIGIDGCEETLNFILNKEFPML